MMLDNTEELDLADKLTALLQGIKRWKSGIEAALAHAHGSHTFDDVVAKIMRGEVDFYTYDDCFLLMQIVVYPQYKTYHCFLASGTQEALDSARDDMLAGARKHGCKYLSITGRHGWVKRLQSRGWEHAYSTMYLEV